MVIIHLLNFKFSKMKKFLPLLMLLCLGSNYGLQAQQASCRTKLDLEAPPTSCSVAITPEMINFGSSDYDQLWVLNPVRNVGIHQVGLVAAKGNDKDTCFTTVKILDVTPPTLIVNSKVFLSLPPTGFAELTKGMLDNGSYDNCGELKMVFSPDFVDCSSVNPSLVKVIAYDNAGNYTVGEVELFIEEKANYTSALACNDLINVNVGPIGSVQINAWDILEGGPYRCPSYYQVVLSDNGVVLPKPEVNATHAGKVLLTRVIDPSTGNSCWGSLKVTYSPCTGPDLCDTQANCTAVTDCAGRHSADDNIEWPCDIVGPYSKVVAEYPAPFVLKAVLGIAQSNVEPVIMENECSRIQYTYTDQTIPTTNKLKILRTWTALNWLTGKVVNYVQSIALEKNLTGQCFICDTNPWNTPLTDCDGGHTNEDAVEWPADFIVHSALIAPHDLEQNPEVHPKNIRPEISGTCTNYSVSLMDAYFPVNDSVLLVERQWNILDFGTLETYSYTQNITVMADISNNERTVCIKSLNGHAVENVQLQTNVFTSGDVCTTFPFDMSQAIVTPSKSDDAKEGIDIEDASILLDHLLGIQPLNDFQKLAADVNLDGNVSSFDLVTILKLITGDQTTLSKVWRFFYLPVGEFNYSLPFQEQADITSPLNSYLFKAVKLGDLNDDNSSSTSGYQTAKLVCKDDVVNAGEILTLDLNADRDFYATALQVEFLKSDKLDYNLIFSELGSFGTETLKDHGDRWVYSWLASDQVAKNGGFYIAKNSPVFNLKFLVKNNAILSDLIYLGVEDHNKLRSASNHPTYLLSLDIEDKITTGTENFEDARDWFVAPNPAATTFHLIHANNVARVDLFSATGQSIKTWHTTDEDFDIKDVNNGVYMVKITNQDATTSVKPLYIIR